MFKYFFIYFPYHDPINFATGFLLTNYDINNIFFSNIASTFFISFINYFDFFFFSYFFFLYFLLVLSYKFIKSQDFIFNNKNFYFLFKFNCDTNKVKFRYSELLNFVAKTDTNIFRILKISLLMNILNNKLIFYFIDRTINFNLLYIIQLKVKKNRSLSIFIQKIRNLSFNRIFHMLFLTKIIFLLLYYL